jgi:hypothetical protein
VNLSVEFSCNDPGDCPGEICCAKVFNAYYTSISCRPTCVAPDVVAGEGDPGVCPQGQSCQPSPILGAGYSFSFWNGDYQGGVLPDCALKNDLIAYNTLVNTENTENNALCNSRPIEHILKRRISPIILAVGGDGVSPIWHHLGPPQNPFQNICGMVGEACPIQFFDHLSRKSGTDTAPSVVDIELVVGSVLL